MRVRCDSAGPKAAQRLVVRIVARIVRAQNALLLDGAGPSHHLPKASVADFENHSRHAQTLEPLGTKAPCASIQQERGSEPVSMAAKLPKEPSQFLVGPGGGHLSVP